MQIILVFGLGVGKRAFYIFVRFAYIVIAGTFPLREKVTQFFTRFFGGNVTAMDLHYQSGSREFHCKTDRLLLFIFLRAARWGGNAIVCIVIHRLFRPSEKESMPDQRLAALNDVA